MSHYSDAEDSMKDIQDFDIGLRKRKLWDPESESITSEIKDLLDEDVNSLVSKLYSVNAKSVHDLLVSSVEVFSFVRRRSEFCKL